MFIRLKKTDGTEVNIVASNLVSFEPNGDSTGSIVVVATGTPIEVQESNRSIRAALKKLGKTEESTED